jgi:hypothetical protein
MRVWRIRTGISTAVMPSDRLPLEAIVRDRDAPQNQVGQAKIVLLSGDGLGTNKIMCRRQVQNLRLALAGTLHARGLRRPAARQDAALAHSAARSGRCGPRGGTHADRSAMRGHTATMVAKEVGISASWECPKFCVRGLRER